MISSWSKTWRTARPHNRGFALLIVMVVLIALSLMMAAVIGATRHYVDETGMRLVLLRLRAATDGALVTVSHDLARAYQSDTAGTPQTIMIGSIAVNTVIRPEVSKLDINTASIDSIARLLHASGFSAERSRTMAKAIVAWRNKSTGDAGTIYEDVSGRAPQRPFETLADLALVPHAGTDLVDCLAPDITIFTHSGNVAFPNASERMRKAFADKIENVGQSTAGYSVVGGAAGLPDIYEITMTAKDEERNVVLRRQVVLRAAGSANGSVWILADTSPAPDQEAAAAACARLAANDK